MNARRDERLRATRVRPEGGASARRRTIELNEQGLRALSGARDALARFREDLASYPDEAEISDLADQGLRDIRAQLSELDLKVSDVGKVDQEVAMAFEMAKRGPSAIPDYLGEQVTELEKLRRQADRGTAENIPVWKVAAIAIAVGAWIWALFRCRWWGSCSYAEGLSYFFVFWLEALVARYDESNKRRFKASLSMSSLSSPKARQPADQEQDQARKTDPEARTGSGQCLMAMDGAGGARVPAASLQSV